MSSSARWDSTFSKRPEIFGAEAGRAAVTHGHLPLFKQRVPGHDPAARTPLKDDLPARGHRHGCWRRRMEVTSQVRLHARTRCALDAVTNDGSVPRDLHIDSASSVTTLTKPLLDPSQPRTDPTVTITAAGVDPVDRRYLLVPRRPSANQHQVQGNPRRSLRATRNSPDPDPSPSQTAILA